MLEQALRLGRQSTNHFAELAKAVQNTRGWVRGYAREMTMQWQWMLTSMASRAVGGNAAAASLFSDAVVEAVEKQLFTDTPT